MGKKLLAFAERFDLWMVAGATIMAFGYFFKGDPLNAIFCILVAMFFGRGQDARFLAGVLKDKEKDS